LLSFTFLFEAFKLLFSLGQTRLASTSFALSGSLPFGVAKVKTFFLFPKNKFYLFFGVFRDFSLPSFFLLLSRFQTFLRTSASFSKRLQRCEFLFSFTKDFLKSFSFPSSPFLTL
jgi:hypothetical protein